MSSQEASFCAKVMNSLNDFRKDGTLCDVTVSVQGTTFPAHRNVLSANSEFFKALFANEMKEKAENIVHMDEFEPKVMDQLLTYMYGGGISIKKDNALDLAIGADFLFLTELKQKACEFLISDLNSENCLFLLYMAEKYNVRELRDSAQQHILENYVPVSASSGFVTLSIEQLLAIVSSDDLVAREEKIFESVVKWTKNSLETRKKHFSSLFSHIRLIYLARCYLITEVQEEDLVKSDESCLRLVNAAKEFFSSPKGAVQSEAHQRPRACQTAILMVGGWQENCDITASSNVFMPSIKQIFQISPMLTPRKNHGIAIHEGLVYVMGGNTKNGNATKSAELYDPRTNTWSSVLSMRKEVVGVGVAMVGDFLYATGGHDAKGRPQSIVQRYSPKINKWECVASMNASRTRHCVVGSTYLYAFGGYSSDEDIPLMSAEYYDHLSDSWVDIAPMNRRRSDACAVSVGSKIFVIGGEDILGSPIKLASCEVYDPATKRWTAIASIQQPRSHAGAAVIKNKVFVLGGVDKSNRELRSVECHDTDQEAWEEVASLPVGIEGFACCAITVPGELMPVLV
ncbi:hypothetical protein ACROYT_G021026 [Oculina patagonica]